MPQSLLKKQKKIEGFIKHLKNILRAPLPEGIDSLEKGKQESKRRNELILHEITEQSKNNPIFSDILKKSHSKYNYDLTSLPALFDSVDRYIKEEKPFAKNVNEAQQEINFPKHIPKKDKYASINVLPEGPGDEPITGTSIPKFTGNANKATLNALIAYYNHAVKTGYERFPLDQRLDIEGLKESQKLFNEVHKRHLHPKNSEKFNKNISKEYEGLKKFNPSEDLAIHNKNALSEGTYNKYRKRYTAPLHDRIHEIRQDAQEHLQEVLPKALGPYLSNWARNHTGAHASALSAAKHVMAPVERHIASLKEQQEEKGHHFAERMVDRSLGAHNQLAQTQYQDVNKNAHLLGQQQLVKKYSNDDWNAYDKRAQQSIDRKATYNQAMLDKNYEEHKAEERFQKEQIDWLRAGVQGQPVQMNREPPARAPYSSASSDMGTLLGGVGRGLVSQPQGQGGAYAKGGKIKRCYKAGGGDLDLAIHNAFVNHLDPVDSLENIEFAKLGRTPMNGGGQLNPQALRHRVLQFAENLSQPKAAHPLVNMLDAGAAALATSKSDSALARWGRGIHGAAEHIKKGENENLAKSFKGHQLIGNLATQLANDEKNERHYKLQERQLANHERQSADTKDYRNKALAMQERVLMAKQVNKRKYTAQDNKLIGELEVLKGKGKELLDTANKFEEIQPKLDTGGFSGAIANAATNFGRIGSHIAAPLVGKAEYVQLFATLSNLAVILKHSDMKNIPRTNEFLKRLDLIKPNLSNDPKVNEAHYNEMKRLGRDMMKHADEGLVRMDIEPEAIIEDRAWGDPKEKHTLDEPSKEEKLPAAKNSNEPSDEEIKEVLRKAGIL